MAGDDRTYTEAEHLALMADAVKRETAELTTAQTDLETSLSEKAARVDVLEAEKVTLEAEKAQIQANFDAFKAEVERALEIETAKQDRVAKIKAANDKLPEAYFTEERVQAWAEMDETAFAIVLDGLTALAGAPAPTETAAFSEGETPTSAKDATKASAGRLFAARRGTTKQD